MSKRKSGSSDQEQGPAKRSRLEALKEQAVELEERQIAIVKGKEVLLRPLKAKVKQLGADYDKEYASELQALAVKVEENEEDQEVAQAYEQLLKLIEEAKQNPDTYYLFDDRKFREDENKKWQPLADLIDKELGGYARCTGYFGLQTIGTFAVALLVTAVCGRELLPARRLAIWRPDVDWRVSRLLLQPRWQHPRCAGVSRRTEFLHLGCARPQD